MTVYSPDALVTSAAACELPYRFASCSNSCTAFQNTHHRLYCTMKNALRAFQRC